jgi:hypothetical protein
MALDRSKFKATVVAATVEQDKELAASLGRDGGNYSKYIKCEDGDNLLRIYPPHPEEDGGGEVFAEPKVTVFLPMMVVERDSNGQPIMESGKPKLKESVKSVFNSRIHANTPKDLVEEYVKLAIETLESDLSHCQDAVAKSQITEKLNRLKGNYALKIQGLNYKSAWVMYVDRIVGSNSTFGPIEIGISVKDRINAIAASTDSANNPLATDPFTGLDDGRALKITYNSKATKPQDYYKTELDNTLVPTVIAGATYNLPRVFPLTDDQLESFMKATPLAKRFKNCFTRRDYELQFEGLTFFDKKYNINLFQNSHFLEICEEIDTYYPEIEESPADGSAKTPLDGVDKQAAPIQAEAVQQVDEPESDMFDFMKRKELADWHKAYKTGILIKPTMSDDDIRASAREFYALTPETTEEEEQEVEQEIEAEHSVETEQDHAEQEVAPPTASAADRIAAMRAKVGS